jgi:hypothetical protein
MTESLISSSSRQLLSCAIAALVIMSLSSCNTKQKKNIAENAVDNFHVLFNDSQYREIYLQADQTYRDAISETDSRAVFILLRQKLGLVEQSREVGWSRNSSTVGTTVRLEYKTDFTNGTATEQFIFLESNGDTRLMNYDIQSPLLIKNR